MNGMARMLGLVAAAAVSMLAGCDGSSVPIDSVTDPDGF
jgi:hypothetical protein